MTKQILYVDEEFFYMGAIVDALKDDGYLVDVVSDGSQAIDKLIRDTYTPDLVILDVFMPPGESIQETNGGRRTGIKVYEIIRK